MAERTTAAQVGERAGYSRSAVRDRYGSKDQLLAAMFARYEALLIGVAADGAPSSLVDLADRVEAFERQWPAWLHAILIVSFESVGVSPGVAPVVRRWATALEAFGTALLTDQQQRGELSASLDPATVAHALVDEVIGLAFRRILTGSIDVPGAYSAWAQRVTERLSGRVASDPR